MTTNLRAAIRAVCKVGIGYEQIMLNERARDVKDCGRIIVRNKVDVAAATIARSASHGVMLDADSITGHYEYASQMGVSNGWYVLVVNVRVLNRAESRMFLTL